MTNTTNAASAETPIERAAKVIAHCFYYPWDHMPEQGRDKMREFAREVQIALGATPQQDNARHPAAPSAPNAASIDMVLHCPACGLQHIDAVEDLPMPMPGSAFEGSAGWTNPPHRSHLCHGCGHIWRPADVPTNGVAAVQTKGKADSPVATQSAMSK